MSTISFYRRNEPYGELSNYASSPISLGGISVKTAEHLYQWLKFADAAPHIGLQILGARTPFIASKIGRDHTPERRGDWATVKNAAMLATLILKFEQNEVSRGILLSTGSAKLIEASPYDPYWGIGRDSQGKNHLGVLLEVVRSLFLTSPATTADATVVVSGEGIRKALMPLLLARVWPLARHPLVTPTATSGE